MFKIRNLLITILLFVTCITSIMAHAAATQKPIAHTKTTKQDLTTLTRENGATISIQNLGDVVVHSYNSPYKAFANGTHIIETANSLVLIDSQFLLPYAKDYRAYADSLGKPIERLIITHEHPDHFLGSEAFADVDVYALEEVVARIEENGQAEIDEKKADFGDAIASSFVIPNKLKPGNVEIDGVNFIFETVLNAEADVKVVTKIPEYGIVSVGDIVYSGTHLILAGSPTSWIAALQNLKKESANYPVVLPGHGLPADASIYDENIAWLEKAAELMDTASSGKAFKAGLVQAFPNLQMDAAIDFVLPYLFPDKTTENKVGRVIEIITMELAPNAKATDFLPVNQFIRDKYVSQQPGYLSRKTGVNDNGQWLIAVQWETKADSDASIAGFEKAPGLEDFIKTLNTETMIITQYELKSGAEKSTFSEAGVLEVITMRLHDGADINQFLSSNRVIRDEYVSKQPGFIGRQTGVSENGDWIITVYWESAEDAQASIANFSKAPGLETFSSFVNFETMKNTIYQLQ